MGFWVNNSTLVSNLSVVNFALNKLHNTANSFRSRIPWFLPYKQHAIGRRNITAGRTEAYRQTGLKEYYRRNMIRNKCSSNGLEPSQAMDAHLKYTEGKKSIQSKTNKATDTHLSHTKGKELSQKATVLVFDIETTGFSNKDKIIEFAAQDLAGGEYSTFQSLVNPGCPVPNKEIHGISTQMVNKPDVPRWKDLAPILVQYVRSRQRDGGPVIWVGHNSRRFDARFIAQEFNHCSLQIPSDWFFVDTLPLAREVMRLSGSKLTAVSLSALREYYQIPLVGSAHRAMSDVNALALVLQKITFELKLTVSGLQEKSFKISDLTSRSNSTKGL